VWQLASGLSNVVLGWPLAALAHTGGAAALAVVLTWALCESRREAAATAPARADDNARGTPTTSTSKAPA
jgi:cytochrome c oxidase assembly protein subunit 15